MKLFSQVFTSLVLSIFGFFLASPIFAMNVESQNTIILSSSFSDTCSWNIQCEEILEGQYICRTTGEILSNQGGSIYHVPVGKSITDTPLCNGESYTYTQESIQEKNILYIGPDTYLYPFVGIIKIQV